ncbi:hypothetical protein QU487_14805 [Crenobacter sp. SG2305]|uniref:hypothetical protein n=1 Tax=Crenobacter oryzisoli TaxID=3056844 RepID=UPI0025AABBD1|nr:hypothetical protein [Crenobacter sp. SG2305]MDN0084009.1 hypothetical protein [Crenobacter sp. SG2305]
MSQPQRQKQPLDTLVHVRLGRDNLFGQTGGVPTVAEVDWAMQPPRSERWRSSIRP